MPLSRFEISPCCGGDPQQIFYRAKEGRVMCGICGHAYEAVGLVYQEEDDADEDLLDDEDGPEFEAEVYDADRDVTYKVVGSSLNDVVSKVISKKVVETSEAEVRTERVVLVDHHSNAPVVSVPALYSMVTGIAEEHMYSLPKYRLDEVAKLSERVKAYTARYAGETLTRDTLDAIEQDVMNVAYSMLYEGEITRS